MNLYGGETIRDPEKIREWREHLRQLDRQRQKAYAEWVQELYAMPLDELAEEAYQHIDDDDLPTEIEIYLRRLKL